jgi:Holliday junction resolvase RusA-like endonuclease
MSLIFDMPRPKCHYRTGKRSAELKDNAPAYHAGRPDATKLTRAVEDALTGIVWRDDSQVAEQHVIKRYGEHPGVTVEIKMLNADGMKEEWN